MKGNSMSGISLYERLLEHHDLFQQILQTLFPRLIAMTNHSTSSSGTQIWNPDRRRDLDEG